MLLYLRRLSHCGFFPSPSSPFSCKKNDCPFSAKMSVRIIFIHASLSIWEWSCIIYPPKGKETIWQVVGWRAHIKAENCVFVFTFQLNNHYFCHFIHWTSVVKGREYTNSASLKNLDINSFLFSKYFLLNWSFKHLFESAC